MAVNANFENQQINIPSPFTAHEPVQKTENKTETVVAIHGIFGAPWSLQYIVQNLKKENRTIVNWGYPSTEKRIEEHGADLIPQLQKIAAANPKMPIHFVGHSMGGLVLRAALNHPDCPLEAKIGRAVLLGTPNKSPAWARFLGQYELPKQIGGIAGRQLMSETGYDSIGQFPHSLDVLVVAGSAGINPFISGDNDGTVAVEETFLNTPHRHVILKTGHKIMLLDKRVSALVTEFLNTSFQASKN